MQGIVSHGRFQLFCFTQSVFHTAAAQRPPRIRNNTVRTKLLTAVLNFQMLMERLANKKRLKALSNSIHWQICVRCCCQKHLFCFPWKSYHQIGTQSNPRYSCTNTRYFLAILLSILGSRYN